MCRAARRLGMNRHSWMSIRRKSSGITAVSVKLFRANVRNVKSILIELVCGKQTHFPLTCVTVARLLRTHSWNEWVSLGSSLGRWGLRGQWLFGFRIFRAFRRTEKERGRKIMSPYWTTSPSTHCEIYVHLVSLCVFFCEISWKPFVTRTILPHLISHWLNWSNYWTPLVFIEPGRVFKISRRRSLFSAARTVLALNYLAFAS